MTTFQRLKKIFIVANGEFPSYRLLSLLDKKSSLLIACDGAGERLLKKKIYPDVIIGDCDSIDIKKIPEDIKIVKKKEQETTDLEKVFRYIKEKIFSPYIVFVTGVFGGRVDFTLYNLHLLSRFADRKVVFIDDNFFVFAVKKSFKIKIKKLNTRISLIPLKDSFIERADGFKYPFEGTVLSVGKKESISNVIVKDEIYIKLSDGLVLLFIDRDFFNGGIPWVR